MKRSTVAIALALCLAGTTAVHANGFNQDNLYFGAGLSNNSASGLSNATGYQFFGGYQLDMVPMGPASLAAEVGYMNSGNFKSQGMKVGSASGLWTTAVVSLPINPQLKALGRLGLDLGDDDGIMFGAGVGYMFNPNMELRGEFVVRDNIDSLQANFVYHF